MKATHKKLLARTNYLVKLLRTRIASEYRYHVNINDTAINIEIMKPVPVTYRFALYGDGGYDVTMIVADGLISQQQHFRGLHEQAVTVGGTVMTSEHRQQAMVFGEAMFRAMSNVSVERRRFSAAVRPAMDSVTTDTKLCCGSLPSDDID